MKIIGVEIMNFRSIEKLKLDLSKLHNKKTLILL